MGGTEGMIYLCPDCGEPMGLHKNRKGGYLLCSSAMCKRFLMVDYETRTIIKGQLPWYSTNPHRRPTRHFTRGGNGFIPPTIEQFIRQVSKDNQSGVTV